MSGVLCIRINWKALHWAVLEQDRVLLENLAPQASTRGIFIPTRYRFGAGAAFAQAKGRAANAGTSIGTAGRGSGLKIDQVVAGADNPFKQ